MDLVILVIFVAFVVGACVIAFMLLDYVGKYPKIMEDSTANLNTFMERAIYFRAALQDAQDKEFVKTIITGDMTHAYTQEEKLNAIGMFQKWIAFEKNMHATACEKYKMRLQEIERERIWRAYFPNYSEQKPDSALFLENVFTDPFCISSDKAEQFIIKRIAEIMVLQGIPDYEARKYQIHQRCYFVNHEITSAIILFDVYRPK